MKAKKPKRIKLPYKQMKIEISKPYNFVNSFGYSEDDYNYYIQQVNRINKYRADNKEVIYARTRDWFRDNKDQVRTKEREYINRNRDKIRSRLRLRRQTDPCYKLKENMRTRMWHGLKGNIKHSKTAILLGCDFDFFKSWLEQKFVPLMSWDNYGSVWHVDHIMPLDAFDLSSEVECKKAFHYTNCQPLFALDNQRKSYKIL